MSEIQIEEGTQENNITIDQFKAGEVEWSELSPEDQEKALNGEEDTPSEETPENTEEKPEIPAQVAENTEDSNEKATEQETEKVEPEEPQDELSVLKKRHYEKSNELNTFVQNQRNHEQRLKTDPIYRKEYLKQIGIESEEKKASVETDDVYSEDYLRQVSELKQELNELKQSRAAEIAESRQNQQMDNTFREIELLQAETPLLKTQKNVRELNELFRQAHIANNGNVTAETMEQMGVSGEDFGRLQTILEINEKRTKDSYPTLRSAFRDSQHFDNLQQKAVSAVTAQSQQALAGKMQEVSNQPHVVDTTAGVAGVQSQGWTDERLRAYFLTNPDPSQFKSKEQTDEYNSAMRAAGIID